MDKTFVGKLVWTILTGLFCLLLCVSIVGFQFMLANNGLINNALRTSDSVFVETDPDSTEDTEYFKSDYDSYTELRAHQDALSEQIQEEGSVLLKNNGALPLAKQSRITLLSQSSVNVVYGGTGAGSVDASTCPDMMTALTAGGFEVNPTVWDFYKRSEAAGNKRATGGWFSSVNAWKLGETPVANFTSTEIDSFASYHDAAIVVISRSGGEGCDLPQGGFGDGNVYLRLQDVEKDLLTFANEHFDNVVVLLNTQNAMEIGFIDQAEYGIDAALWIGTVGQDGLNALSGLLNGDAVPSGRLVDTYAANSLSSASVQNSDTHFYGNWEEQLVAKYEDRGDGNVARNGTWRVDGPYVIYAEGIYMGYRYYETRYEDSVLGGRNADANAGATDGSGWDYNEEIVYPFGYGISYTTFTQTLDGVRDAGDHYEVTVTVNNTGTTYTSKDVVQIYAQSEFTEYDRTNKIEKAAVELVGFTKTKAIAPGGHETVVVNVDKRDLATYDEYGAKTYIMDAGEYYLSVGSDAHNAVNNILAAKGKTMTDGMDEAGNAALTYHWTVNNIDDETYSTSSTGYDITNQFDKSELADYGYENIVKTTRADWNTFPKEIQIDVNDELARDTLWSDGDYWEATGSTDTSDIITGAETEYKLIAMRGMDYDDDAWRLLINQMTIDDMINLIANGGYGNVAIANVDKDAAVDADGASGFSGRDIGDVKTIAYQAAIVLASTWNTEILYEVGKCVGEDGLQLGISGWYAPSLNIHRTPYSGRNFEYFSEDAFFSGKLAAPEVRGAQEKGLYAYIKHFAINDMETERHGIAVFADEQTLREVYLPAFQYPVEEGNAHGVMSSFNRIGGIWTGAHYGLLTEVLRNEWGFEGAVVTDAANSIYMDVGRGVLAGNDLWLTIRMDSAANLRIRNPQNDRNLLLAMRESCHRILFMVVNSNAMNGVSTTMMAVPQLPWWKVAMIWANIATSVLFLGSLVMLLWTTDKAVRAKRKGEEK